MVRTKRRRKPHKPLGTIWEVPEPLWLRIKPILEEFWPKKRTGRRPANWRLILNGIIFRMRTGCQWDQLPRRFGPKSTVHDWFQRWVEGGVFEKIWAVLISECDELRAVEWKWQAADGALGKARFGGSSRSEPDRPRQGWHQAEPDRRWARWTARGRGGRSERQ
jgi:putative transposase